MRKIFFLLPFLSLSFICLNAETREARESMRHEIRVGWGDQLFETLMWHEKPVNTLMPIGYEEKRDEHFRYTQHWFFEYQYRFKPWFGLGFQVDGSGVIWDQVTRNGIGQVVNKDENHNFYNIIVMPTIRFTYLHKEYVSLYSALGLGLCVNGGTEKDWKTGKKTIVGAAFEPVWLGMTVGHGHWFGALELTGMHALRDKETVFQLGSRLMTASVGCTF